MPCRTLILAVLKGEMPESRGKKLPLDSRALKASSTHPL